MSDSLWPHGLQHIRLPCPSLAPRVCSNSGPLSLWCHPTVLSSAIPFRGLSAQSLSHVWLFVTPWTVAHQVPLSVGFSRQEYWSGLPFPPLLKRLKNTSSPWALAWPLGGWVCMLRGHTPPRMAAGSTSPQRAHAAAQRLQSQGRWLLGTCTASKSHVQLISVI